MREQHQQDSQAGQQRLRPASLVEACCPTRAPDNDPLYSNTSDIMYITSLRDHLDSGLLMVLAKENMAT